MGNTTEAYRILTEDYGFDIPFNPYRAPVQFDDPNFGTILPEPYFFGADPSTAISDDWWKSFNLETPGYNRKFETAFNNKYLQFMSLAKYGKPTTTCVSFCNLFDADEDTNDSSFAFRSNNMKMYCDQAPLKDAFDCYNCQDNTPEQNA